MKKLFLVSIFFLFTACAPRYTWEHPYNNTQYAFDGNAAECDMYAQNEKMNAYGALRGNPMAGLIMISVYDRAFENCMYTKGWRKKSQ